MTHNEIVSAFMLGSCTLDKGGKLWIENSYLIYANTRIAKLFCGLEGIVINEYKYSPACTQIVNKLIRRAKIQRKMIVTVYNCNDVVGQYNTKRELFA